MQIWHCGQDVKAEPAWIRLFQISLAKLDLSLSLDQETLGRAELRRHSPRDRCGASRRRHGR